MRWTEQQLSDHRAQAARLAQQVGQGPIASPAPPQAARRAKYRNVRVTDSKGRVHDSAKEHRRWQELELLARAGAITELRRQVPFALVVEGILIGRYIADFVFDEGAATIVEDVKSPPTRMLQLYQWKKRLMLAVHKIEIREI